VEIQQCIATQNFEYAAQLRDIYRHIDVFVEKQHVVVDLSVT
jgi:protein-arginine kinase activator protein McsA